MTTQTRIEWASHCWNPIVGCTAVSPGCKHCYATSMAWRLAHHPHPDIKATYRGLTKKDRQGRVVWTDTLRILSDRLEDPLRWRKPRRVFVNSMSDLFHPDLHQRSIAAVWGVMAATPTHTYQVLTKRPELARMFLDQDLPILAGHLRRTFPHDPTRWRILQVLHAAALSQGASLQGTHDAEWPLSNVWLGASVESAEYVDRIVALRDCPAAVRFLSLEPLLGALPDLDLSGIDWVIVGDESGPRRRPAQLDWVREIRDQCLAAGVAFFFKQWHEGRRKISTPELDGRRWVEWPDGVGRAAA